MAGNTLITAVVGGRCSRAIANMCSRHIPDQELVKHLVLGRPAKGEPSHADRHKHGHEQVLLRDPN